MSLSKEYGMQKMWTNIAKNYGNAKDLEEKQRFILAEFLINKTGRVLELGCGNGKILNKIQGVNANLELNGLDYNINMIKEAKSNYSNIKFIHGDIIKIDEVIKSEKFNIVFSVNSLHNLPTRELINITLEKMYDLVDIGGFIIFDVRNIHNPFINYGYSKNRKKGLNFWTLNHFQILNKMKKRGVDIIIKKGVFYNNIDESVFHHESKALRFLYGLYLKITSLTIFSPYIFIVLKKK